MSQVYYCPPEGLAFDNIGDLFAACLTTGTLYEFTTNGVKSTFASGLGNPEGLAFEPVPALQADATGSGLQLSVSMPPAYYYSNIVQASTDLVNWVDIYTNTPPFTLTDSMATTFPYRFYRALLGP